VYTVIKYPDTRLRVHCLPGDTQDAELFSRVCAELLAVLAEDPNVLGIAAPQLGYQLRVIAMRDTVGRACILVNPEIISSSGSQMSTEGCLSIPGVSVRVPRRMNCTVRALDGTLRPLVLNASGRVAAILQHELDHLHGRLVLDLLSGSARHKAEHEARRHYT